jgi:hypothetical protein
MHLTMLSALARSGVDPWMEAAGLAALSRENATQKLVVMLAGVPNGPSPGEDTANLAGRLVAQLHSSPEPRLKPNPASVTDSPAEGPRLSFALLPSPLRLAIYSLVAFLFVVMCFRAFGSRETTAPAETSQQEPR